MSVMQKKMMFGTMHQADLYPPLYFSHSTTGLDAVTVVLLNLNRPGIWEQVGDYIDKQGSIANSQVREILGTDDTLKVSKLLKEWVEKGLLVVENPQAGLLGKRFFERS